MSETPLSFLNLPREVRDLCYSYLLTAKDDEDEGFGRLLCGFACRFPMTVFLLNRQITQEASLVLYSTNPYIFGLERPYGPMKAFPIRRRQQMNIKGIQTLAASPVRALVKTFVLRITLDCYRLEDRDGLDLWIKHGRNPMPLEQVITLLQQGPLLDNLKILLHMADERRANSGPPMGSSVLFEVFDRLAHRVRKVEVDYLLHEPQVLKGYLSRYLGHLEELRQKLQYQASKKASLLGLPRECRDMIYYYLVSKKDHKTPTQGSWKPVPSTFSTALLRTCHQINEEATVCLYSNMTVSILVGLSTPQMVMARVPPRYRHLIKHYEIAIIERYDSPPTYEKVLDVCQELRAGPRIKSVGIQIEVAIVPWYGPKSCDFIDGFAPLNDHVDEVRVGVLKRTSYGSSSFGRADECYRRLKGVLPGPAKWTFPYPEYQFKD